MIAPAPPPSPPSDALHQLARRVRRLPAFGRLGPEAVAEERDEIAVELERLARAGRASQAAPSPATPPRHAPSMRPAADLLARERARRLEALARSQAAELERLRCMLAQIG